VQTAEIIPNSCISIDKHSKWTQERARMIISHLI